MSIKRVFIAALTLLLLVTFCEETFAQRHQRGPIRRAGEFLGLGWGVGNHWQARPTSPDYYNPYTAHNSRLISRTPHGMDMGMGMSYQNNQYGNMYNDQIQMQELPGTVIPAEIETHPAAIQNGSSTKGENNDDDSDDDSELSYGGDFSTKGAALFERPVLADPEYKPTVDNKVKEKLNQLDSDDFWNDQ